MSKLFSEEQQVLNHLLAEWYEEIKGFTQDADGIFSEKGKMYDRTSPVWERIRFPYGFLQELRKKTDRLGQLLEPYPSKVRWGEILEELQDVMNYARMFGALAQMVMARESDAAIVGGYGDNECAMLRRATDALKGAILDKVSEYVPKHDANDYTEATRATPPEEMMP